MARTTKPPSSEPQNGEPENSEPENSAPQGNEPQGNGIPERSSTKKISPPKSAFDRAATQVLPTEQFATVEDSGPPPDTGIQTSTSADDSDPERRSFVRRHPVGSTLVGAAIAVLLASGITAWGVGAAVTSSLTSATTPAAPANAAPAAGSTAGGSGGAAAGLGGKNRLAGEVVVRATIDSIDGSTWTVTTRRGQAATLTIDSATKFGTKRVPATASSFAAGDTVVIFATRTGGAPGSATATATGTAIRIAAAKTGAGTQTDPTTPAPTSTPTT